MYFSHYTCTEKLELSPERALCMLDLYFKVPVFGAGAEEMYFAYYTSTASCDFEVQHVA